MIKVAVCDDELQCREWIRTCLQQYAQTRGIAVQIDEFGSGKAFLALGADISNYTVLFLDIEMDELDGLTVARMIRSFNKKLELVFVTAYVKYTLDGYRYRALRYILKGRENFQKAIEECMDEVLEMQEQSAWRSFSFREKTVDLPLDQILYIESRLHQLLFYLLGQKKAAYTMRATLNTLEKDLAAHHFIRIHQSYLVNAKYILDVEDYKAHLINGERLTIPKVRYRKVKDAFMKEKGILN